MADIYASESHASTNLLSDPKSTVSSQIATLANFYLTTWEEYHTGVRFFICPITQNILVLDIYTWLIDCDSTLLILQTLYLSSFSGPVEGILLVISVFLITSVFGKNNISHMKASRELYAPLTRIPFAGPGFWDQGILTVTRLKSIGLIKMLHLKDVPLNECAMLFAIISLASNTIGR